MALLALLQPEQQPTDEAFDGALLVAAFLRDVHLIRTSYVEMKYPEQDIDG